jgi:hypothetical protein
MSNPAFYSLVNDGRLTGNVIGAVLGGSTVVSSASSLVFDRDNYAGRTVVINAAAGCAITLPAATGSGSVYRIILGTTVTSNSTTIKVANAVDSMIGRAFVISDNAAAVLGYAAATSDDTITLNGSTTGGFVGDHIMIIDAAPAVFYAQVLGRGTGTEATPFSATVS